jgi:MSHA biogenesis protein MshP
MHLNPRLQKPYQRGLGLVSAIFVIVVLALLVAGMSKVMMLSQSYRAQEILAARALLAAQSGTELHLSQLLHPDNSGVCSSDSAAVLLTINGLEGCSYQATCNAIVIDTQSFFTVESIGRCGTGVDSATRIVRTRVAN